MITSAKEVMFSSVLVNLFVCLEDCAKTTQQNFTKFGGSVAHWPQKKPLYSVGNSESVTLGLLLGGDVGRTPPGMMRVTQSLFRPNSNNFTTSVALTEVCALLSVILVQCCSLTLLLGRHEGHPSCNRLPLRLCPKFPLWSSSRISA